MTHFLWHNHYAGNPNAETTFPLCNIFFLWKRLAHKAIASRILSRWNFRKQQQIFAETLFLKVDDTHTQNKGTQETFDGDGYVYDLDCDDSSQVYIYVQTHQIIHIKYMQFFYV